MVGLLYKDFVALRCKRLLVSLILFVCIFCILSVTFSGDRIPEALILIDDAGNKGSLMGAFLVTFEGLFLLMAVFLCNMWLSKLVQTDSSHRMKNYIAALPCSKRTYVASKYIFMVAMLTAMLLFYCILHAVCARVTLFAPLVPLSDLLWNLALPMISFSLFCASLELPLFLLLGKNRGMMIITLILELMFMAVIGFLLFGDLKQLDKIDPARILSWVRRHETELRIASILSPVIYILSFLLTSGLCRKKEDDFD